jgi:hypothetical protein
MYEHYRDTHVCVSAGLIVRAQKMVAAAELGSIQPYQPTTQAHGSRLKT